MTRSKSIKVTVSLPRELVQFADALAAQASLSRSGALAALLEEKRRERLHALMAEGYTELAEESLHDAEQALGLTREVALGDD